MNKEIIIGTVTFDELMDAMRSSTEDHWKEVPFGPYKMELELDEEMYRNAEANGHSRFYVAFVGREAVAYMSIMASSMCQHKGILHAVTDAYYVKPEYRKDGIFAKLLEYVEQDIKELGIRFLTIGHNPQYKGKTPELLESVGYAVTEVAYTKEV